MDGEGSWYNKQASQELPSLSRVASCSLLRSLCILDLNKNHTGRQKKYIYQTVSVDIFSCRKVFLFFPTTEGDGSVHRQCLVNVLLNASVGFAHAKIISRKCDYPCLLVCPCVSLCVDITKLTFAENIYLCISVATYMTFVVLTYGSETFHHTKEQEGKARSAHRGMETEMFDDTLRDRKRATW